MMQPWKEIGEIEKIAPNDAQIEWRITNFVRMFIVDNNKFSYKSPTFFLADASWSLRLKLKDTFSKQKCLFLWTEMHLEYSVEYNVTLKNPNGDVQVSGIMEGTMKHSDNHRTVRDRERDLGTCLIENILLYDNFTITCMLRRVITHSTQPNVLDKIKFESSVGRLIENFKTLLDNKQGSDVILKTNDYEFHAHTQILSARCPVFESMFWHDMIEKKTGEVDVSDCSTAGFKVFLQFLYTGNADTMSPDNVLDLYYIADKYQVDDLKTHCVEYMKNTLSVDNFCDVMALSLKHDDSDLRNAAIDFFCTNIKKIVKTVQWQQYLTENPIHANELIIKAVNA